MSTIQDIFIPDLGGDTDVDLIDIMVAVGDTVEVEDGLITLETEKASMDVPTTHAGVIKEILVEVGSKANSGDLIARIEIQDDSSASEEVSAPVAASTPASNSNSLESAEAELQAISASGAEVSCQFVDEQTICSVVEEVYIPDLGGDKM